MYNLLEARKTFEPTQGWGGRLAPTSDVAALDAGYVCGDWFLVVVSIGLMLPENETFFAALHGKPLAVTVRLQNARGAARQVCHSGSCVI